MTMMKAVDSDGIPPARASEGVTADHAATLRVIRECMEDGRLAQHLGAPILRGLEKLAPFLDSIPWASVVYDVQKALLLRVITLALQGARCGDVQQATDRGAEAVLFVRFAAQVGAMTPTFAAAVLRQINMATQLASTPAAQVTALEWAQAQVQTWPLRPTPFDRSQRGNTLCETLRVYVSMRLPLPAP